MLLTKVVIISFCLSSHLVNTFSPHFYLYLFLFLRFLFPLKRHQRARAVVQWADWLGANVDELWERQHGRPAIGHKGLDFKPNSSEQ
jgi:hypothetical protein